MAQSLFDCVARALEEKTTLAELEARGTLRLALKEAGLDAASVTPEQMDVVLSRVMPAELVARGVDAPDSVCEALRGVVKGFSGPAASTDTPEAVFARLANS
jgi:hypothetical protein